MEYDRDEESALKRGICPFCGGEMESGYLYSAYGIGWTREEPRFRVKNRSTLAWSSWGWSTLEGARCTNCKAIIVPHTQKEIVGTLYQCPHCGARYHYDFDKVQGNRLVCQNCSKEFDIPGKDEDQIGEKPNM